MCTYLSLWTNIERHDGYLIKIEIKDVDIFEIIKNWDIRNIGLFFKIIFKYVLSLFIWIDNIPPNYLLLCMVRFTLKIQNSFVVIRKKNEV